MWGVYKLVRRGGNNHLRPIYFNNWNLNGNYTLSTFSPQHVSFWCLPFATTNASIYTTWHPPLSNIFTGWKLWQWRNESTITGYLEACFPKQTPLPEEATLLYIHLHKCRNAVSTWTSSGSQPMREQHVADFEERARILSRQDLSEPYYSLHLQTSQ